MSELWSEDRCTCGHAQSKHADGTGLCDACNEDASWNPHIPDARVCRRYQWNGKKRTRV